MKIFIHNKHRESKDRRERHKKVIRLIVQQAWQACTNSHTPLQILRSMPKRCQEFIPAKGGHFRD